MDSYKLIHLDEFDHEPGPLPRAIRVNRNYMDENGYFVTDSVWVTPLSWNIYKQSRQYWGVQRLMHAEAHEHIKGSLRSIVLRSTTLRSGDTLTIMLSNEVTDVNDPAYADNKFQLVGWGMRPALGLTLMFVITRLLAFKHKVLSRFYAPSAPGAGILKRDFEAEF